MFDMSRNGIITVSRGDSFSISKPINIGTPIFPEYYEMKEGDKVYCGIMEPNKPFEKAIIRKVATKENQVDGNVIINFDPMDTVHLLQGTYYYSLKLVRLIDGKEYVITYVPNTKFVIID